MPPNSSIVSSLDALRAAGWGEPDYLVAISGGEQQQGAARGWKEINLLPSISRRTSLAAWSARAAAACLQAPGHRLTPPTRWPASPCTGGLIPARILRSVLRHASKQGGCAQIKVRCCFARAACGGAPHSKLQWTKQPDCAVDAPLPPPQQGFRCGGGQQGHCRRAAIAASATNLAHPCNYAGDRS